MALSSPVACFSVERGIKCFRTSEKKWGDCCNPQAKIIRENLQTHETSIPKNMWQHYRKMKRKKYIFKRLAETEKTCSRIWPTELLCSRTIPSGWKIWSLVILTYTLNLFFSAFKLIQPLVLIQPLNFWISIEGIL